MDGGLNTPQDQFSSCLPFQHSALLAGAVPRDLFLLKVLLICGRSNQRNRSLSEIKSFTPLLAKPWSSALCQDHGLFDQALTPDLHDRVDKMVLILPSLGLNSWAQKSRVKGSSKTVGHLTFS